MSTLLQCPGGRYAQQLPQRNAVAPGTQGAAPLSQKWASLYPLQSVSPLYDKASQFRAPGYVRPPRVYSHEQFDAVHRRRLSTHPSLAHWLQAAWTVDSYGQCEVFALRYNLRVPIFPCGRAKRPELAPRS